jgi:hypothetical protein
MYLRIFLATTKAKQAPLTLSGAGNGSVHGKQQCKRVVDYSYLLQHEEVGALSLKAIANMDTTGDFQSVIELLSLPDPPHRIRLIN